MKKILDSQWGLIFTSEFYWWPSEYANELTTQISRWFQAIITKNVNNSQDFYVYFDNDKDWPVSRLKYNKWQRNSTAIRS